MQKTFTQLSVSIALIALLAAHNNLHAQLVDVVGGQTSVALDFTTLESAASLAFSSVSADVIAPGAIADSVAFPILSRDAASTPTTFQFDPDAFSTNFSGSIGHSGSVFFNSDSVEVGDFTIGFDVMRVGGAKSGFFVESTTGVEAILFDIVNVDPLTPTNTDLTIGADLAVSPEFGGFLLSNSLSTSNLEGAIVGAALVQATVPEPSSIGLMLLACFGIVASRRTRRN